jgi:hypothetical protein
VVPSGRRGPIEDAAVEPQLETIGVVEGDDPTDLRFDDRRVLDALAVQVVDPRFDRSAVCDGECDRVEPAESLRGLRVLTQREAEVAKPRNVATVTPSAAASSLVALLSPHLFAILRMRGGWSLDRYRDWIEARVADALLVK